MLCYVTVNGIRSLLSRYVKSNPLKQTDYSLNFEVAPPTQGFAVYAGERVWQL